MKASPAAWHLIEVEEGKHLVPYICPSNRWTVGIGHQLYPGDQVPGITYDGKKWTGAIDEQTVIKLLTADLVRFERAVSDYVKVSLMQCEFDALVSFTFNCGVQNFAKSTLLAKLNQGKPKRVVAAEFARWNKGDGGKILDGLTVRRAFEIVMFLGG